MHHKRVAITHHAVSTRFLLQHKSEIFAAHIRVHSVNGVLFAKSFLSNLVSPLCVFGSVDKHGISHSFMDFVSAVKGFGLRFGDAAHFVEYQRSKSPSASNPMAFSPSPTVSMPQFPFRQCLPPRRSPTLSFHPEMLKPGIFPLTAYCG